MKKVNYIDNIERVNISLGKNIANDFAYLCIAKGLSKEDELEKMIKHFINCKRDDIIGYIYVIKNKINDKVYIGQSIHPVKRFQEHLRIDRTNKLGKALYDLGKENFYLEILEKVYDKSEMNDKERYYINLYDSLENGYNEKDSKVTYHYKYNKLSTE